MMRRSRGSINRPAWWTTSFLVVASLTILLPLYIAAATAFKQPKEIAAGNPLALPSAPYLENFATAWRITNFPRALAITALVAVLSTCLVLVTNSMVAYAIARNLHKRRYRAIYFYFLSALFVPFPIVMLPLVKQTAAIGLDSPIGVIVLNTVFGLAFNTFLYVAFLSSVPISLEESARLDGASTWGVFWRIIFPLLGPMNATVGILAFLGAWNDFLLPLVIISDRDLQTLTVVNYLFQGQFNVNYGPAFASYLMTITPIVVAYLFSQRWVLSGVMRGSVK